MLVSSSDGFWREGLFAAILLSALAMVAVVVVMFKRKSRNFNKFFGNGIVNSLSCGPRIDHHGQ
jgi:hypothetical protein